jgi:fructosamine-3-kinase
MTGGEDISWKDLGRIVREWAGDPAELTEVIPLTGGSVNNTLLLVTGDYRKAVLKITPHRINRQVEVEAFQLDLLRGLGIPVPRVYQCHVASLENPNSYLLMEHIDGITLAEAKKQLTPDQYDLLEQELADLTAALHQQTREHYGKVDGSGNHLTDNWPAFYRSLHDQAVHVTSGVKDIPVKLRKKIEKLHERLDKYLAHTDRPRLLHGDLWSANVMCRQDDGGQWKIAAILDPNLRYGHAESELAYLELFETSNSAFKKTYQRTHKLDDDYHRVRKPIYQLYPLIDHVHLFGKKYVEPMMKVADRATAVV